MKGKERQMRPQDIKIGEYYRLKTSPNFGYVKALEILRPKAGKNVKSYIIVECEHVSRKDDMYGFIRCFRPRDLSDCQ